MAQNINLEDSARQIEKLRSDLDSKVHDNHKMTEETVYLKNEISEANSKLQ